MKSKFIIFPAIAIIYALAAFSIPSISYAQSSNSGDPSGFSAGLDAVKNVASEQKLSQAKSSKEILQSIVGWLTSLLATVALISLLYGGYLYVSSQGDEGNVERAKAILLYSVIGLILVGLSGVIVNVVISVATQ